MARMNGWNKDNTLIIEDTPETCIKNYGNAIYVPPFESGGGEDENVLTKLMSFIKQLDSNGRIRSTEKRNWLVGLTKK